MDINRNNLIIFGDADQDTIKQIESCMLDDSIGVLSADNHKGYSMPIGGAVAYKNHISPSGVGYDIGCGNKAVKTNIKSKDINIKDVMDLIFQRISFGMGRTNKKSIDHEVLSEIENADFKPQRELLKLASDQLGTVGGGNHYVDIFEDEEGWVWIGVHFGSRGFGHKTASGFLAMSMGLDFDKSISNTEMDSPPVLFELDSELGQAYLSAMTLAGKYAYAGRDVVVNEVLDILGAKSVEEIHNHHNFAWKEKHFGEDYWVIRKGCTPAFPNQKGFVGSNMSDESVIIEGVESPKSQQALYSTVHGAGRIISRRQAAGNYKFKRGKLVKVKEGIVDFEAVKEQLKKQNIELRGGGADEAPEVYKKLMDVLDFHKNTINIIHKLKPIGIAMAGSDTFDLYKD